MSSTPQALQDSSLSQSSTESQGDDCKRGLETSGTSNNLESGCHEPSRHSPLKQAREFDGNFIETEYERKKGICVSNAENLLRLMLFIELEHTDRNAQKCPLGKDSTSRQGSRLARINYCQPSQMIDDNTISR